MPAPKNNRNAAGNRGNPNPLPGPGRKVYPKPVLDARSLAFKLEELRAGLDKRPATVAVGLVRELLPTLEAAQEWQRQAQEVEALTQRLTELTEAYNRFWQLAQERGIHVGQPIGSNAWHWTHNGRSGVEVTPEAALIAALAAREGKE